MFRLPSANSPAFEAMGDVAHVVEILKPANVGRLSDFRSALREARATLAATPAAKAVTVVCLRADDERWLVRVTPRAWRCLHNFSRDAHGRRIAA